ncbi:MAG TPA: sensor domain-containing diguanylate cyclase [Chondromyces sp.]|nr:sensor domain-containing diguanylate cyclase [Chondromyces sp.]
MNIKKGIKLQFSIGLLVILSVLCTTIISWYSSDQALKDELTKHHLESNYIYANKLSSNTSDLLNHMQQNIIAMGKFLGRQEIGQEELDELRSANDHHFNSLFLVDSTGVIQLISPAVVQYKKNEVKTGVKIQSKTIQKALSIKKPFISEPYHATSGQLILLVSSPIFNQSGNYQGLIGGTIYLESNNAINHMLNEHERSNGSYTYVVDRTGRIIFHPDSKRINEVVPENKVIQRVLEGRGGSMPSVNSEGRKFFAGYAYEENTGWGIITQTPVSVIEKPLHDLFERFILQSLPLLLLIMLIGGLYASNLAKPINTLARFSEDALNDKNLPISLNKVKTKSNIYEVRQLYYHINNYLNLLNNQIQLDGLTGLANRRTFDLEIKQCLRQNIPFSIIMLDIDYFKKVNDTYGHLVGDDVLRFLSSMICTVSSENDLCFRYGGEEFGILMKHTGTEDVFKTAEQLRIKMAESISPTGGPITISLGITSRQEEDRHAEEIIKRADSALYQSKANGRNQTTIYG